MMGHFYTFRLPILILCSLFIFVHHGECDQAMEQVIETFHVSALAARESIQSGSMTYSSMQEFRYGLPNNSSQGTVSDADVVRYQDTGTLIFKKNKGDILWIVWRKGSREIIQNPSGYDDGMPEFDYCVSYDGENSYRQNFPNKDFIISPGESGFPFGPRFLIEHAGIPSLFFFGSKDNSQQNIVPAVMSEYRLIWEKDNLIKIGYYPSIYQNELLMIEETLNKDYDGRCIESVSYRTFGRTDTMKLFALPYLKEWYSGYQRFSNNIWFPMRIKRELSSPFVSIEDSSVEMVPTATLEIEIHQCEFNIPVEDSLFMIEPASGSSVVDTILGVEFRQ